MEQILEGNLRAELEQRRQRLLSIPTGTETRRFTELIGEIDAALARFDAGDIGVCEGCHESIEPERIAADPTTRVCLDCLSPDERTALERDLELAGRIQRRLLPDRSIRYGGWNSFYHYEPHGPVSGDHFDVVLPDSNGDDLFFMFGDVSGKGVAASILTAHLQASFRSLVEPRRDLAGIVQQANHLFATSTPASSYATLVFGRLSVGGRMELANAGHPAPQLRLGGAVTSMEPTGLPLGMFAGETFETRTFDVAPDDLLLLYTDGLTESSNVDEDFYGTERITRLLANGVARSSRLATEALFEDVSRFRGGVANHDDLTLMAFHRDGAPGRSRST